MNGVTTIIAQTTAKRIICGGCGETVVERYCLTGVRHEGRHPEHRYCPRCGRSVDWYGWRRADGDGPEAA